MSVMRFFISKYLADLSIGFFICKDYIHEIAFKSFTKISLTNHFYSKTNILFWHTLVCPICHIY